MSHGNFKILKCLLELIDDFRNDIFIHIDAKVQKFNFSLYESYCKVSRIFFIKNRVDVKWGGYEQVQVELNLFEEATSKRQYSYYHLISGVDLPLKTQNEIHDFFIAENKEFLFYRDVYSKWDYQRLSRYHLPRSWNSKFVSYFNIIQDRLEINRFRKYGLQFRRGYNWCSLTDDAVRYILGKKGLIKRFCHASVCADECYKQIILFNSQFRDRLFINDSGESSDLRAVDWVRRNGDSPHIYTSEDYEILIQSEKMFARKFDEKIDIDIVNRIVSHVKEKKNCEDRNSNNL